MGQALGEEGSRLAELVLAANAATKRDLSALKAEVGELREEASEGREGLKGAAETCQAAPHGVA